MSERKYLDPAYSLIKAAAENGSLGRGIDAVAEIVGRNRTNVYRWMIPTERGGTGGLIPTAARRKLHEHARQHRGPAWLQSFFGEAIAA